MGERERIAGSSRNRRSVYNDEFNFPFPIPSHKAIASIPTQHSIPADYTRWPSVKIADAFGKLDYIEQLKSAVKELGKFINK